MSSGSGNVSAVVSFGGAALSSNVANGISPYITLPPSLLANVVTLTGGYYPADSSQFYGLYSSTSPSTQAKYQVPSGKTLYVLGVYYTNSLGTGLQILFGYGTAAIASEGTTTPPTGAIYYGSGNSVFVSGLSTAAAAGAYTYMPIPMSFPANSYPFVKFYGGGYAGCVLICYLQ